MKKQDKTKCKKQVVIQEKIKYDEKNEENEIEKTNVLWGIC